MAGDIYFTSKLLVISNFVRRYLRGIVVKRDGNHSLQISRFCALFMYRRLSSSPTAGVESQTAAPGDPVPTNGGIFQSFIKRFPCLQKVSDQVLVVQHEAERCV
jgi:hypothetical protein